MRFSKNGGQANNLQKDKQVDRLNHSSARAYGCVVEPHLAVKGWCIIEPNFLDPSETQWNRGFRAGVDPNNVKIFRMSLRRVFCWFRNIGCFRVRFRCCSENTFYCGCFFWGGARVQNERNWCFRTTFLLVLFEVLGASDSRTCFVIFLRSGLIFCLCMDSFTTPCFLFFFFFLLFSFAFVIFLFVYFCSCWSPAYFSLFRCCFSFVFLLYSVSFSCPFCSCYSFLPPSSSPSSSSSSLFFLWAGPHIA